MTDKKKELREWILYGRASEDNELVFLSDFEGPGLSEGESVVVREISHSLDEAYREMERAVERIACANKPLPDGEQGRGPESMQYWRAQELQSRDIATEALSKLREARK